MKQYPICLICRERHDESRGLTFDGFGINSCGMYRDRIATFYSHDAGKRLGPLFANARELQAALRLTLATVELHTGNGARSQPNWSKDKHGNVDYEAVAKVARVALAKVQS